jgi:hypothetical protein
MRDGNNLTTADVLYIVTHIMLDTRGWEDLTEEYEYSDSKILWQDVSDKIFPRRKK